MMRIFPHSLALKLTFCVFAVLLVGAIALGLITMSSLSRGIAESDQRRSYEQLQNLYRDFEIYLAKPNLNNDAVFGIFHKFRALNPYLIPLLVDDKGEIIISALDKGLFESKFIDSEVLLNFNISHLPVYIASPRKPNEKALFASKKISISSFNGYLVLLHDIVSPNQGILISATARALLFQILIVALLSLILGLALSRLLTNRLRALTSAVEGYSPGSRISFEVINSKDEIGILSKSFKRMTEDIERAFLSLKERDTLRRELIAGVSHDFRTPLSSIQGYVQQLKRLFARNEVTTELRDDYLNTIERNSLILTSLMESLSELSRLDHSVAQLKRENVSLNKLFQDLAKRFAPECFDRKIDLKLDIAVETVLFIDPELFERAVSNIIDNALRYAKSLVIISAKSFKESVNISIQDNGSGIKDSDLPNIFQPFYRGDKAREKDKGGSGLGLAIAKSIIEAHGGKISVNNVASHGASFEISIPR